MKNKSYIAPYHFYLFEDVTGGLFIASVKNENDDNERVTRIIPQNGFFDFLENATDAEGTVDYMGILIRVEDDSSFDPIYDEDGEIDHRKIYDIGIVSDDDILRADAIIQNTVASPVEKLANITGKQERTIYYMAKKLGRLPTVDEIKATKSGRPLKYK